MKLPLLVLAFFAVHIMSSSAEPERLTQLRESWVSAQKRSVATARGIYLSDLENLKVSLTKDSKLDEALSVRSEIKAIENEPFPRVRQAEPGVLEEFKQRYLDEAWRLMDANNKRYVKALETLRDKVAESGDLSGAVLVRDEIESVEKFGKMISTPSTLAIDPADLPRTKRQLRDFLENTNWVTTGGELKFRSESQMFMPWHPCRWLVTDKRSAKMVHPENAWSHTLQFSEDMVELTVLDGDGPKVMWKGTFVGRATSAELMREAENVKDE